jgi:hypothetical protein
MVQSQSSHKDDSDADFGTMNWSAHKQQKHLPDIRVNQEDGTFRDILNIKQQKTLSGKSSSTYGGRKQR